MPKFTQGKWKLDKEAGIIFAGNDKCIAQVIYADNGSYSTDEGRANARLIVAAPKMYEWIDDMLEYLAEFATYKGNALVKLMDKGRELQDRIDDKENEA